VYGDDFVGGMEYPTIAGVAVRVSKDNNGQVFVNDAKVVRTDYLINNGVMHILDE
jgi:uncharacterized surface protein with fasciclin (FAS1) repeats